MCKPLPVTVVPQRVQGRALDALDAIDAMEAMDRVRLVPSQAGEQSAGPDRAAGRQADERPPTVLHVAETTDGGVGTVLRQLLAAQVEAGWRVLVAAPHDPVTAAAIGAARWVDWRPGAKPGPGWPGQLRTLAALVRTEQPDLVHLHTSMAGLSGRLVLRGRRPTLFQPHSWSFYAVTGPARRVALTWERFGARWSTAVLCVSEDERTQAVRARIGGRLQVVPNGVALDGVRPAREQARRDLGLSPDEPLVVCVGRLHRQKNQHQLLDVWPQVLAAVPLARLALVGEGPDRDALQARRPERTLFVGHTSDVPTWLAAADVVVQPSLWEGMSLSLLEAMAAARPVVVTDVPGMREVVRPGTGAVVAPGDDAALAAAVLARLQDPALAEQEGASARACVVAEHDLTRQTEQVLDLAGTLLRPAQPSGRRLRVLVVQPFSGHGGSESWLLRLLDATDELDVSVLLLQDGPLRTELEARGLPVVVRPVGNSPLDLVAPVRELTARLRSDPPDVVLANVLKAQMVAGPAARRAGVPVVWAKHDHSYDRTLALPMSRLATRVVAAVEELGVAARRSDVVVVPPPRPDRDPAPRSEARAHLTALGVTFDDDHPVAVMAGRLVPFKGVDDALHALALPEAATWRLVVAGTDDPSAPGETRRLQDLADQLGVAGRVCFAGQVPEVSHYLAAFDALLVLTRPGGRRSPRMEGFGTSAFEAMLAAVPVVAVRGGAVVRRLEGRAGIGVGPSDAVGVARALGRLADPAVRAAAGRAGREITADHPDAAACAASLVEVLRQAAGAGRNALR